jgi:SAM-dependent methyltransferase
MDSRTAPTPADAGGRRASRRHAGPGRTALSATDAGAPAPPVGPWALNRMAFASLAEFDAFLGRHRPLLNATFRHLQDMLSAVAEDPAGNVRVPGVCDLCAARTVFTVPFTSSASEGRVFSARDARCSGCGLPQRKRHITRAFLDDFAGRQPAIYISEQVTGYYRYLAKRFPGLQGSEYIGPEHASGTEVNGVRHEDMTRLSFADASFDVVIASEVLEHIPDWQAALVECARVLRPGGRAYMTFPFLRNTHQTRVRAVIEDGAIRHLLPPQFHGDPVRKEGILCFQEFGWDVLDAFRAAGFTAAWTEFVLGPTHGHFALDSPVIVGVTS